MKQKRTGNAQVHLDDELRSALRAAAVSEERTQAAIIRRALRKYLGLKITEDKRG